MKNKIYEKIQKIKEEMEYDWTASEFEDCLTKLELMCTESKIWDDQSPKTDDQKETIDIAILTGMIDSVVGWICDIIRNVDKKEMLELINVINELKSINIEISKIGNYNVETVLTKQTRCYSFKIAETKDEENE
jgi:hypothetical protein